MNYTKEKGINVPNGSKSQNGNKAKKGKKKTKVSYVLLFLFVLLYMPALWNWIFHDGIDTEVLNTGLLDMRIPLEGVFVREEIAIKSPGDGIIISKVNQGERVPNKFTIAHMVDKNSRQTLERIEKMEKEVIRHAIEENPGIIDGNSDFRNKIQNEVNKLTKPAISKTMEPVREIKTALEQLLNKRNKEIFLAKGDKLYLQNEKDELNHLKDLINENAVEIKAEFSGLVMWDDAYDEKYSPENMEQLTPEDLSHNSKNKEKEVKYINSGEYFTAAENQVIARLVNNEKTWFVCMLDAKKAEQIKQNKTFRLKIEGMDRHFPCTVESVIPEGDKIRVILAVTQLVEETVHLRSAKADLIINSIKGLKVPSRSLTNINIYDNTADIILVRLNRAVIKRVRIIAQQDGIAIISALPDTKETDPVRIFDIFVVNPQNISEGQVIE